MKALIVTGRRPEMAGGVERFSTSLAQCMEANGWQVSWLTGQDVSGLRSFNSWQELVNVWRVGRTVSKLSEQHDLIISNGSWGAFIPKRYNRINVYHGTAAASYQIFPNLTILNYAGLWIKTYLERKSGRFSYNVAVSEQVKQEVSRYYKNNVHSVNMISAGSEFFPVTKNEKLILRKTLGIADNAIVVLYVGRMEFAKGTDCLFNIAQRSRQDFPDIVFLVVAPQAEKKWLNDRIRFLDGNDKQNVLRAYGASDIMLFPSRYEGYGYVTLEALSCGIPVIGGPTGAAAVLKAHDKLLGEFITEKWDEELFYEKLIKYVSLPAEQRRGISEQAQKYIQEWSGPVKFCQQWQRTIADALASRKP